METKSELSIEAVILAGGRGTRIGSSEKGLTMLAGKPLIQHVAERLALQIDHITVSCNTNLDQYRNTLTPLRNKQGAKLVNRYLPDNPQHKYHGPLAGIAAMLEVSTADYIFACPCDTPLIPLDIVKRLHSSLHYKPAETGQTTLLDASYPMHQNRSQHLMVLFNRLSGLAALQSLNDPKLNKPVKQWLQQLSVNTIRYADDEPGFTNVNTVKQLKTMEKSL